MPTRPPSAKDAPPRKPAPAAASAHPATRAGRPAGPAVLRALVVMLGLFLPHAAAEPEAPAFPCLLEAPRTEEDLIRLPVRIHLIRATVPKAGEELTMWLKPEDVTDTLLPEVNRIWQPARIQWFVEKVIVEDPTPGEELDGKLRKIGESDRTTPDRTDLIRSLADPGQHHPVVHNLHFVAFVGSTTQGFAFFDGPGSPDKNPDGGNRCFVGVWTDKPFGGKKPPIRFPLVEPLPFKIGSIARTVAHELGHNLLLQHPDKATQTEFERLMGGRKHGYRLIGDEIRTARRVAAGRIATINAWVAGQRK